MKIGIPRALLYYKYGDFWHHFFDYLNIEIMISSKTNKKILKKGTKFSVDEACLSSKIYMGHVEYLIDKCDYIFVPRIACVCKKEEICAKFMALHDIVKNTFKNVNVLSLDIDYQNRKYEKKEYTKMAMSLGYTKNKALSAYKYAEKKQKEIIKIRLNKQKKILKKSNLKILIVSHPYNIYDDLIGKPILDFFNEQNVDLIMADVAPSDIARQKSKKIAKTMYWTYNKELTGAIEIYKNQVDGILIISSFPCGTDSIVNDLVIRKVKAIPISTIVIDGLDGNAGLATRLESFVDILTLKKEGDIN